MVVASDERSAAGGITNIVRSLGMSAAPLLLGYLSAAQQRDGWVFSSPWFIAGGVKIVYDVTLYGLYLTDATMNSAEAAAPEVARREAAAAAATAVAPAPVPAPAPAAERAADDDLARPLLAADDDAAADEEAR